MESYLSDLLQWELSTVLSSAFLGMAAAFIYDCIRVVRRIIRHKKVWTIAVEDIIYWVCMSFLAFSATYNLSNGAVRGFMVVTAILGALLYRAVLGKYYVKYMTKLINFLIKPLKKIGGLINIKLGHLKELCKKRKPEKSKKKGGIKSWYLNRSMKGSKD